MPLLPEKPKVGTPLVAWLTSLWEFTQSLVWSVDADSGLEAEWTRAGWKLRVLPFGIHLAKTSGTTGSFSGGIPGSGNAYFALWDGTTITYETVLTPFKNPFVQVPATGKHCWIVRWFRTFWIISWDC